jgi:DNA-directed RNA polymerase specialized sigma subunit
VTRKLNKEQRALFDAHRGLAVHLAEKYARRYPLIDLDDLIALADDALWYAARKHDPAQKAPFGAFAMRGILWALWRRVNREPEPTVPLDEPINDADTWADYADYRFAQDEESARIPDENELAVVGKLHELIRTLPTLTKRERRILQLQYVRRWPMPRVRARLGGPVSTESARAIRKLRQAMRDLGFRALPPSAPVVGPITGRPRAA